MNFFKKFAAEFLGTFIFVLFGCGVSVVFRTTSLAPATAYLGTAIAFGFGLIVAYYCVGSISGCHVNPAVSLGMLISKKMSILEFLVYIVGQFCGGVIAALLLQGFFHLSGNQALDLGANQVNTGMVGNGGDSLALGFGIVTLLSFIFVFLTIQLSSKKDNNSVSGLVAGLTLIVIYLLETAFTGGSINPARSLGPALTAMINGIYEPIKQIWIFILAPLVGGTLAGGLYTLFTHFSHKKEMRLGINR